MVMTGPNEVTRQTLFCRQGFLYSRVSTDDRNPVLHAAPWFLIHV